MGVEHGEDMQGTENMCPQLKGVLFMVWTPAPKGVNCRKNEIPAAATAANQKLIL